MNSCFSCALACLVLIAAAVAPTLAADSQEDQTVYGLFIGNSFYDFYLIPEQVEAMVVHAGGKAEFRRETKRGFTFKQHWEEGNARKRIETEKKWGIVALQSQSRDALDNRESFDEFGRKLIEFTRKNSNADIYLYMTWAHKKTPEEQATITEAYCTLAVKEGVKVAPVGLAITSWMKQHPETDLLRDDGASHPNELGAYLSACVWYATITGKSPVGQTSRIAGRNWLTGGDMLVDVEPEMAKRLQRHAWETVLRFDLTDYARSSAQRVPVQSPVP